MTHAIRFHSPRAPSALRGHTGFRRYLGCGQPQCGSGCPAAAFRLRYALTKAGRVYRYRGFVEREGVRHLGPSVLFVTAESLPGLLAFLREQGVEHVVTSAWLGATVPS